MYNSCGVNCIYNFLCSKDRSNPVINYHFRQLLMNLFTRNGSIKVSNFYGIIALSSKGVDCTIFHDFWMKFWGPPIFWGTKTLFWQFLRDWLDRIWWKWYGWKALVNLRRFRLFRGFYKNLIFLDAFTCPQPVVYIGCHWNDYKRDLKNKIK